MVRFSALPTVLLEDIKFLRLSQMTANWLADLGIIFSGGAVRWILYYQSGGSMSNATSTEVAIAINTWYCVVLRVLCSTADGNLDGEYQVWIDEVELDDLNKTGIDTDYTYIDNVRVGQLVSDYTVTNYIDCVCIDDDCRPSCDYSDPFTSTTSTSTSTSTTSTSTSTSTTPPP